MTLSGVGTVVNLAFTAAATRNVTVTVPPNCRPLGSRPSIRERRATEQFKIGDTVVRRGSVSARRGSVVRVTDGFFVTVKWPSWLGLDAYESTHPPDDLVRLMA